MTAEKITTVSCPGKVLVAGGYLVLESPNPGVVLGGSPGASSRVFSSITALPVCSSEINGDQFAEIVPPISDGCSRTPLDVYSPQFDSVFKYWLEYSTDEVDYNDATVILRLSPRCQRYKPNPYIEKAIALTLSYIQVHALGIGAFSQKISDCEDGGNKTLSVKIRAGNDFYSPLFHLNSRGMEATPCNVAALPQFLPCPKVVDEQTGQEKVVVHKTGMGSSAALIASIVGALLSYFDVVSLSETSNDASENHKHGKRIAHNLAQICHCSAQGKVGSGFDVSAAIYGTHIYRRFGKNILSRLLDDIDSAAVKNSCSVTSKIARDIAIITEDAIGNIWDSQTTPFSLPECLELIMADVSTGSASPSMARQVLAWRKELKDGADNPWERLKETNESLEKMFRDELSNTTFLKAMKKYSSTLARIPLEEWRHMNPCNSPCDEDRLKCPDDLTSTLLRLRNLLLESRKQLKAMGEAAGVPIEPDGQSSLANATMMLPGVVCAGVPGAGGYDALYVLYVKGNDVDHGKSDEVREKIGQLWREWAKTNAGSDVELVCPLAVRGGTMSSGICSVSEVGW